MKCPNCGKENSDEEEYCEDCGAQLAPAPAETGEEKQVESLLMPGNDLLGHYLIIKAEAGSKVNRYSAQDRRHDCKEVHIYELDLPDQEGAYNPLKFQWDILRDINDPRFPALIDFFQEGTKYYLVTERTCGESFEDIMKREKTPFPPEKVFCWGITICEALGLLHRKNALHLNIQPSNIYLRSDETLLITGFDRICPLDSPPGECAVTAGFSAPEAYGIGEGRTDARSDVYSIGATLYSLIAGKTPCLDQRESFFNFPPLGDNENAIHGDMENVIMTAVNKKSEARFQTVEAFREALKGALSHKDDPAAPPPLPDVPPGGAMPVNVGMLSHIGMIREINQDSCLCLNFSFYEKSELKKGELYIVADGMGGEAEGEKASSLAIRAISKHVFEKNVPIETGYKTRVLEPARTHASLISDALKEANRVVFEYAKSDMSRKGMGSTISAAIIEGNSLTVGHAGDTRVYLISKGGIEQISEDHSLVGRLVKMGQLKKEEALKSPQRSLVYRALGTNPELEVDIIERTLEPGDYVFICSDGCWEYYLDDELLKIFMEHREPQSICNRLVELCLERGADDNCTAIVVRMGESA